MKEEKNSGSKKMGQLFRKKWFFPAVYLTVAALLLTFVVWYQNLETVPEVQTDQESTDTATDQFGEDATTVMEQKEVVKMPVSNQDQAEIVTKFYDYNADQEAKESALVLYNSRYYQSTGINVANASGETFDVTASLSGTVEKVEEDPLLGNVVTLSHENDLKTYYASLGEVKVKEGTDVKQGDVLGTAGQNIFGKEAGVHVHFEIRKAGEPVNPETYLNQPVSSIQVKEETKSGATEEDDSGTTSEENSGEQSTTPEDETTGTEDEATNPEDNTGTEDEATNPEDSTGTEDEATNPEDSTGTEDDAANQDEEMTPDDSTNEENSQSNDGAESSASSASA